eukprot:753946-Hanusia_phi.AAC.3
MGAVAIAVIVYACVQLTGSPHDANAHTQQLHQPVSASESTVKAGQVRAAHQRLHLKNIMTQPAIHWAQNYLIEQVAKWARTHPTKPGHDGMMLILKVAEEIRAKVCPQGSPCPKDILSRIEDTASVRDQDELLCD